MTLCRCDLDLTAGCVRVRAAFSERRAPGSATPGPPKSKAACRVIRKDRCLLCPRRWSTAAFLVRAGFLVVWLPLGVHGFATVLARGRHEVRHS
jgi:hypothetical protein